LREKILSFFSFVSDEIWDISPDSPLAFVFYLFIIMCLCIIMIIYISKRFKNSSDLLDNNREITFNDLLKIAKHPSSTKADLYVALQLFNEKFSVKYDVKKSFEFLKYILHHKNRHKKLFEYFHGSILPKNITFKDELDKLEREALNK